MDKNKNGHNQAPDPNKIYPICIAPPVSTKQGIRFMHPKNPLDINEYTKELWAILFWCNGRHTVEQIIEKCGVNKKISQLLINDLFKAEIILDCNSLGDNFHHISSKSLYPSGMTLKQSIHYADSIYLSQKKGENCHLGKPIKTTIGALSAKRKSCRSFSGKPLTLSELTTLLTNAYSMRFYPVASAGGLYPLRIYVMLVQPVGTLRQGYYQFMPHNDSFIRLPIPFDYEEVAYICNSDTLLFGAPAAIIIAGDLKIQSHKYGPLGYQMTLIENGEVIQNICLTATELKLGSLVLGNENGDLNPLLKLESREVALSMVAVGQASLKPTFDAAEVYDELVDHLVGPDHPVVSIEAATKTVYNDKLHFHSYEATFAQGPVPNPLEPNEERTTFGTALSSTLAGIKAIAEATERWASMQFRIDRKSSAIKLNKPWLDPRIVAPYDKTQYKKLNLKTFAPTINWEWVEGKELSTGSKIYVPVDLVFYGQYYELLHRQPCIWGDSSGVAAHFSPEEAIRRAMLELIERDAFVQCWFSHKAPKRLPYESLPEQFRNKIDFWKEQGRIVEVLDLSQHNTAIIGILIHGPTYPCLSSGFSASDKNVEEALTKAFQEAQLGLIYALTQPPRDPIDPAKVSKCSDHALLYSYPKYISRVKWIWSGPLKKFSTEIKPVENQFSKLKAVAVNLSRGDTAPLYVYRVLSTELVPISFGAGTGYHAHHMIKDSVDARSVSIPHFYA